MAKGQAERLIPLLEDLMSEEGFGWSDLDALAVGIGPGNFTGIRISVAAARGLALALGIPVIPVSNFEILRGPNTLSDKRPQLVSLPAPRGSNYVQLFADGHAAGSAKHITATALQMPDIDLPAGTEILGSNALDIGVLAGRHKGQDIPGVFGAEVSDVAATLIRIAAEKWAAGIVPKESPVPLYIKPPDAAPPRITAPGIRA